MESFNNIDIWLKELKVHANPDAKVFLIGNKLDLEENRKVPKELALKYKEDYKIDYFTECSAKSGINAKEVFIEATKVLYNDYLKYRDSVRTCLLTYYLYLCNFIYIQRSSSFMSNASTFRQKTITENRSILQATKNDEEKQKKKGGCC